MKSTSSSAKRSAACGEDGVYEWSSTEISAKAVDLHWHEVPQAFKASELSQVGFAGAFVAVLDVVRASGEAICAATPDGMDFRIRWR